MRYEASTRTCPSCQPKGSFYTTPSLTTMTEPPHPSPRSCLEIFSEPLCPFTLPKLLHPVPWHSLTTHCLHCYQFLDFREDLPYPPQTHSTLTCYIQPSDPVRSTPHYSHRLRDISCTSAMSTLSTCFHSTQVISNL